MADNVWTTTSSTDYSVAGNWSLGHVPTVGEDVWLQKGAADIVSGLGQSAVVLDSFTAMNGYTGTVGSSAGYLEISLGNNDRLNWLGTGLAYVDLNTSATPDVIVKKTFAPQAGGRGLYLLGDNIGVLSVEDGNVGLAAIPAEIATVAFLFLGGSSDVHVGVGTAAITDVIVKDGVLLLEADTTEFVMDGGLVTMEGSSAHSDITVNGGEMVYNSSGAISALNVNGGHIDFHQNGVTKSITSVKMQPPGAFTYHVETLDFVMNEPDAKQVVTLSAS